MGYYSRQKLVQEFARRTIKNLETIERLAAERLKSEEPEVFEVTQLLNSCLGLLVFPEQKLPDDIPKVLPSKLPVLKIITNNPDPLSNVPTAPKTTGVVSRSSSVRTHEKVLVTKPLIGYAQTRFPVLTTHYVPHSLSTEGKKMNQIFVKMEGVPYGHKKPKGNTRAPNEWTRKVVSQTKELPKIKEECFLRVTFLLPPNKFPIDLPHGPDLDNLLKRFLDALNQTIFSETLGGDSCVVSQSATKSKVQSVNMAGALLEVSPADVP